MIEIEASMNCVLSVMENEFGGAKTTMNGVLLNKHPYNSKLWLVKSGERLIWMLESYINIVAN